MAAYDSLLGSGGNGTILPSIAKADNMVKSIKDNLDAIERTMSRLSGHASSIPAAFGSSMPGAGMGGGTASNGMPVRTGGVQPSVGGGMAHGNGMPSSFGLGAPIPHAVSSPTFNPMFMPSQGGGGNHGVLRGVGLEMAQQGFQALRAGVPDKMQSDLIWNRITMMSGGNQAFQRALPGNIANLYYGGFASRSDMNAGLLTAINSGVSSATLLNAGFANDQRRASQGLGLTMAQTMQMTTGILGNYNGWFQSRVFGENLLGSNGDPRSLVQQLNEELRTGRGSAQSVSDIDRGLTQFGGLNYNLRTEMGLSQEQIAQVKPLFEAAMKAGTGIDTNNPKFRAALKSINGGDTALAFAMNKAGAAAQVSADQYSGWRDGIDAANEAASGLAQTLDNLNNKLGGAPGYAAGSAGGFMGGVGQTALGTGINATLEGLIFRQFLGKGGTGGIPGIAGLGSLASRVPGMGGLAGRLGGVGAMAGGLGAVGLGAAGLGTLAGTGALHGVEKRHLHGTAETAAEFATQTLGYAGSGALIGGMFGPEGVPVGAAIGGVVGLGKSILDAFKGGDSKTDSDKAKNHYSQWAPDVADAVKIICGRFHITATTYPGHEPDQQHAADFWPSPLDQGTQIAEWAKQNAGPLNIQYVIWRQHIWNIARASEGWRQMEDRGSRTQNHFDHVHISFRGGPVGKTSDGTSASSDSLSSVQDTGATTGGAADSSVSGFFNSAQNAAAAIGMTSNSLAQASAAVGSVGSVGPSASSSSSTTATPSAPSGVSGNVALGKQMAASYGWGSGKEWNALYQLWNRESGWNASAQNPHSTAYGIAQFLDSTWGDYGFKKSSDPRTQISAGLKYIKSRYGDPLSAWGHETNIGWYDKGAWKLDKDQVSVTHKGEMIVPKDFADAIRDVFSQQQAGGSGHAGGGCTVTLQVIAKGASDEEALALAKKVKKLLDHDNHIDSIGSR